MKVLHLYRTCYPVTKGGVEQVIRYICKGTRKLGVESRILSLSDNDLHETEFEDTKLVLCKKNFEISSNSFSFQLAKQFKTQSQWADIIHFHYPWPAGDYLSLFNKSKPTIVTYHSDIIRQKALKILYSPLEKYFLHKVDRIIATSPQYASTSKNLNRFKEKTAIIPLAIDHEDYKINPDNQKKWETRFANDFFFTIGVLRYYKGLRFLLEASEQNKIPLVIAGDGPEKKELDRIVRKKKLTNVTLLGHISDIDKISLLSICKAFVFPSYLRSEAFGVSLLEAQHFAKPIISCNIGTGVNSVNIHNQTGLVVEPANSDELSLAMKSLNENETLRLQFGKSGKDRMKKNFSLLKQAQEYFKFYDILLNGKKD